MEETPSKDWSTDIYKINIFCQYYTLIVYLHTTLTKTPAGCKNQAHKYKTEMFEIM